MLIPIQDDRLSLVPTSNGTPRIIFAPFDYRGLDSRVLDIDRHPYPVPLKVYDETIRVMKSAMLKAKLGRDEEMQALQRLDNQARRLEATAEGPALQSFLASERAASPALGGRSVFGWEKDLAVKRVADL